MNTTNRNSEPVLSLRERVALTIRGWKLLIRYTGSLYLGLMVMTVLKTVRPYVTIWASAGVLNELTGARDPMRLALYAGLAVLLNFALQAGIKKLDYNGFSNGYASNFLMFNGFQKMFADKQLFMDYEDIENAGIQRQVKKVRESLFFYGNGLGQLGWSAEMLIDGIVSIAASAALSASLFSAGSGVWGSSWWAVPIALLLFASAWLVGRNEEKSERIFKQYSSQSTWYNRTFQFFGWELYSDLARAKDVRIYRQNVTADHALAEMQRRDHETGDPVATRLSLQDSLNSIISGLCYSFVYLFVVLKAQSGAFGAGGVVQYVGALSLLAAGVQYLMEFSAQNKI